MVALISVVIPTLNAAHQLPKTLVPIISATAAGFVKEVIFVDGHSTDETKIIAAELGVKFITGARGRGGQLDTGARAATGEWLLFLHADSILEEKWFEKIDKHITTKQTGYFKLKFDTSHRMSKLVAGWANIRARLLGLPYGDQGLLISRCTYQEAGGFKHIPLMEDVEFVRRLRTTQINAYVTTSAQRYEHDGWIQRGSRNLLCLALFYAGMSVTRISELYNRTRC